MKHEFTAWPKKADGCQEKRFCEELPQNNCILIRWEDEQVQRRKWVAGPYFTSWVKDLDSVTFLGTGCCG